mmetsp:Transcript_17553/g.36433  ORF Transcript_17553/g.36433 Transcript_17553/m.36433 type:complete len:297 (+) Transcript_17553:484-1374(+)
MGRASKEKRDIYYRKAKELGFRARSAFKLMQLDEEMSLLDGVNRVVDLCAAPGSWSQVVAKRLRPLETDARIVAVDLQEMAPIPGVTILQGDITQRATLDAIMDALGSVKADLVISDGAPDVTGMHDIDEYVQLQLIVSALNVVNAVLKDGGTFVAKVFRQRDTALLYRRLSVFFPDVVVAKPRASRNSSIEAFVVCRSYKLPEGFHSCPIDPFDVTANQHALYAGPANPLIVPFVACGDLSGYDADVHYDLDMDDAGHPVPALAPVQSPIRPPYAEAIARLRQQHPDPTEWDDDD